MAPFLVAWALTWIVLLMPSLPSPGSPWQVARFVVALVFLVYCIIVLLVDVGLHLG